MVRSISIVADTSSISARKIAQLESHGVLQRLDNVLMGKLAAVGRFGSTGRIQLQISLAEFRCRPAAWALWGALAGPDFLGAAVTGSTEGRSFEFYTRTSSLQGGSLDAAWEVTRLNRLIETLARRIIAGLDAEAESAE